MKRKILIRITGILFLAVGLISLFIFPAEFTSFYAFTEGGKFHYEGFAFGSLMFAFIISNAMAYFTFAVFCIPLGMGNLKLKKWGLNLSLACLKTISIIGMTLMIAFLFSFELIKKLELYQTLLILSFLIIFLIALPFAAIKFYINPKTGSLFQESVPGNYFEKQSTNQLTVLLLNYFWMMVFYLLIFLKGAFPLWGEFIFKKEGVYLISTAVFVLLVISYFFYKNKYRAEIASLIYYLFLFFTFAFTYFKYSTNDFLNKLSLPVYEMEKIVPAFWIPAGINLGVFFGTLIIIQIFLVVMVKIKK